MKIEEIYQPLIINIALSGYVPEGCREDLIIKQVKRSMDYILDGASKYNEESFGYSGKEFQLNILSSPSVADSFAVRVAREHGGKFICALPCSLEASGEHNEITEEFISLADSLTQLDYDPAFPQMAKSGVMKWLLDQSDLAIVLWDGRESSFGGDQWNMLQAARERDIPSIWVDINSPVDVYWTIRGHSEVLNIIHINKYLEDILGLSKERIRYLSELINPGDKRSPWWRCFYSRFIKSNRIVKDPVPEDPMMITEDSDFEASKNSRGCRTHLLGFFKAADSAAIESSENYRSTIYLRAIFPLIICCALAFGFYAETILGWILGPNAFGLRNFWGWVAALGFGIHGMLSFLMFKLSSYSNKRGWHRKFIGHRYIAEALRLAVHFIPFGIPMGDLSLSTYGNKVKRNPEVLHRLRGIMRSVDIPSVNYNKSLAEECLDNIEHLVDSQIVYHRNTLRQYERICKRLKSVADNVFIAGIAIVVARSIIQVILQFTGISGSTNGISNLNLVKSAANMAALIIPTIAAHFSLKLSYCNFEGIVDSSSNMVNDLTGIKRTIQNERRRDNIRFDDIYRLSREMTRLVLGEVSDWYSQLTGKKITR